MKTRKIALLVAILMIMSILSSCAPSSDADPSPGSPTGQPPASSSNGGDDPGGNDDDVLHELTLPLTETKETLKVWTLYINNYVPDPSVFAAVQKMEEITNVHIEWTPIGFTELTEKFNQLMMSKDLPDIIYAAGLEIPGGIEKAHEDGFFMDITDLVRKYMPNYRAILDMDPNYKRDALTDSGKYLFISNPNAGLNGIEAAPPFIGLTIRKDLLERLDKEIPETMDEWYDVLTAGKNAGMTAPLSVSALGYGASSDFISPFGILQHFYMDNNTVKYGALQPEYRTWIETMRKWYAEGLIDPNFTSVVEGAYMPDATFIATDACLAFTTLYTFTYDGLFTSGYTRDPNCVLVPLKNPVLNKGDKSKANLQRMTIGLPTYITSQCRNPELAAKWLDYQMTEEAMFLNFIGIEGETYTRDADGTIRFTDLIMNDPSGLSPTNALNYHVRGNGLGRYFNDTDRIIDPDNPKMEAMYVWSDAEDLAVPIKAMMTADENRDYTNKFTAISTFVSEQTVKYITGMESLDDYDKFIQTIYDYGIEDCLKYRQAAADRYLNRG